MRRGKEQNRKGMEKPTGVQRKIVGYHQDENRDWVAELDCGHQQHVRHNPPWLNREWVTTPQGREQHLGHELICLKCVTESSRVVK
jgi:hypothetical protein